MSPRAPRKAPTIRSESDTGRAKTRARRQISSDPIDAALEASPFEFDSEHIAMSATEMPDETRSTLTIEDWTMLNLDTVATSPGFVAAGPLASVTDTFAITDDADGDYFVQIAQVTIGALSNPGALTITSDGLSGDPTLVSTPPQFAITQPAAAAGTFANLSDLNTQGLPAAASSDTVTITITYAPSLALQQLGVPIVTELTATLADDDGDVFAKSTARGVDTLVANPAFTLAGVSDPNGARPGQSVSDVFTLTNASAFAGTFTVTQALAIGPDGPLEFSFSYNGSTAMSAQTLNAALASAPVAPGSSVSVTVVYAGPDADSGQTVFIALTATFTATVTPNGAAPFAVTSLAQTAPVYDAVKPVPSVTIANVSGSQTVIPTTTATDTFSLTNASGQPATFTIASIDLALGGAHFGQTPFTGFTVTSESGHVVEAATIAALNAQLRFMPIDAAGVVTLAATHTVPAGPRGAPLIDTLIAQASAGGTTQAGTSSGAVTSMLGALGDILTSVVASLDAVYAQPAKRLTPAQLNAIESTLQSASRQVAFYANDSGASDATPDLLRRDLAYALAIHDLADLLSERVISQDGAPLTFDTVP